ncbi:hypothetical protein [Undibacterium flavidum]|uniref:Uncharacterized protein n=1 Tax=Undibacterium flavidum TaxID=2762297 RepID=A0ABR6YH63_9BURK|nr:hypothetical protein [Undibacterium flavidum]MBC3875924.1 hypothetical protein [Undibacterium flavidum]
MTKKTVLFGALLSSLISITLAHAQTEVRTRPNIKVDPKVLKNVQVTKTETVTPAPAKNDAPAPPPPPANTAKTDDDGFNIGGKIAEQNLIAKSIPLDRNEESNAFPIGAILKAGQKVLFEIEVQDRSHWNNSNEYYCKVIESGSGKQMMYISLPVIDTSQFQNKKTTTGTSRLTSGTHAMVYSDNSSQGMVLLYQVVCGGHQWGAPTGSIFVRVKKTIFE